MGTRGGIASKFSFDHTRASHQMLSQPVVVHHTVPCGTGLPRASFRAIDCLATIIQSLRDKAQVLLYTNEPGSDFGKCTQLRSRRRRRTRRTLSSFRARSRFRGRLCFRGRRCFRTWSLFWTRRRYERRRTLWTRRRFRRRRTLWTWRRNCWRR